VRRKELGTLAWTLALSASYALIIFSAPILGAYADTHAAKKKLLAVTTAGCVLGTALLALVGPGDLALAVALIIVSNVFLSEPARTSQAAFLPELARGDAMGKVSLGLVLGLYRWSDHFGCVLGVRDWARSHGYTEAQFVPSRW